MAYQSTVGRPMWVANGYTLPQHAFIPPVGNAHLASGHVTDPVINSGRVGLPSIRPAPNVTGSPTNVHTYTWHL